MQFVYLYMDLNKLNICGLFTLISSFALKVRICDIKRRRELRRNKTHSFLMTKKKKKPGKIFYEYNYLIYR